MCSTGERLAQLDLAIDQLAAEASAAAGRHGPAERDDGDPRPAGQLAANSERRAAGRGSAAHAPQQPPDATPASVSRQSAVSGSAASPAESQASRLAELWAMLAELDPDMARRLPDYLS